MRCSLKPSSVRNYSGDALNSVNLIGCTVYSMFGLGRTTNLKLASVSRLVVL